MCSARASPAVLCWTDQIHFTIFSFNDSAICSDMQRYAAIFSFGGRFGQVYEHTGALKKAHTPINQERESARDRLSCDAFAEVTFLLLLSLTQSLSCFLVMHSRDA